MATDFLVTWSQIEPPGTAALRTVMRAEFRRQSVAWVRGAYDRQLALGIGADGGRLMPIHALTRLARKNDINPVTGKRPYSPMGRASVSNPPLMATGAASRTRQLMRAEQVDKGVRIFWVYDPDTGYNWGDILQHHATGFSKFFRYPRHGWGYVHARDVFGLAPGTISAIHLAGADWLRTGARALARPTETVEQRFRIEGIEATVDLNRITFGIGATRETVLAAARAGTLTPARQSVYAAPIGPAGGKPPPPKPRPKPTPKPPGTPILVGRPLVERIAAYKDGDKKLTQIAKIQSTVIDLVQERSKLEWEIERSQQQEPGAIDAMTAYAYSNKIDKLNVRIAKAKALVNDKVLKALEIKPERRADWNVTGQSTTSTAIDVKSKFAIEKLKKVVHKGNLAQDVWIDVKQIPQGQDQRAYQMQYQSPQIKHSSINMTSFNSEAVHAHEIGHALEWQIPGVHERCMEFLAHRCGDEPFTNLNDKFGGFDDSEKGRQDKFFKAFPKERDAYYVGKQYDDASEVLSMGLQALWENPTRFAQQDPEFCKFILGILDGSLR